MPVETTTFPWTSNPVTGTFIPGSGYRVFVDVSGVAYYPPYVPATWQVGYIPTQIVIEFTLPATFPYIRFVLTDSAGGTMVTTVGWLSYTAGSHSLTLSVAHNGFDVARLDAQANTEAGSEIMTVTSITLLPLAGAVTNFWTSKIGCVER